MKADLRGVLTRCSSCGKTNRLPYAHLDRTIRCGNCHTVLPPLGEPVETLDARSFDVLVQQAPLPVLVDFWAPWCGPCRMMAPEVETAARNMAGTTVVVKVDTEAVPELGQRFRILSIPTLALFRHGREITRVAGARPASEIEALVART